MPDIGDHDGGRGGGDGTLRHSYDWETSRPSTAVVEMVAVATDTAPLALQPLFDAVDPEALDALVSGDGDEPVAPDTSVSFRYAGFDVTVRCDGVVTVAPAGSDGDGS